jgi:hypothetical protein
MFEEKIMKKEYYKIYQSHPFFNGFFTREKLITLIEKKEKEGWKYVGNKSLLKIGSFGIGLGKSDFLYPDWVAVMERDSYRSAGLPSCRLSPDTE